MGGKCVLAFWISLRDVCQVKELCLSLKQRGIEARSFWKPIHLQKPYVHVEKSDMMVAESVWDRIIMLPSSTGITKEQLEYVVTAVRELL